jgi:hypothetical protein
VLHSYFGTELGKSLHVDKWFKGIESPLFRNWLTSTTTNTVVGGTFGGTFALANGQDVGTGVWGGVKNGLMTGAISGLGNGVIYSDKYNVNLLTGKPIYPGNDGFAGKTEILTLKPGDVIDRYGGTNKTSRFTSPQGTSIEARSLPPDANLSIYEKFQVAKPFQVQSGTVAPWFGQSGGGIQYVTSPIDLLINQGYITRIQ